MHMHLQCKRILYERIGHGYALIIEQSTDYQLKSMFYFTLPCVHM